MNRLKEIDHRMRNIYYILFFASIMLIGLILHDVHKEHQMIDMIRQFEGKSLPDNLEQIAERYSAKIDQMDRKVQITRFRRFWRILKAMDLNYSLTVAVYIRDGNVAESISGAYFPTWEKMR